MLQGRTNNGFFSFLNNLQFCQLNYIFLAFYFAPCAHVTPPTSTYVNHPAGGGHLRATLFGAGALSEALNGVPTKKKEQPHRHLHGWRATTEEGGDEKFAERGRSSRKLLGLAV